MAFFNIQSQANWAQDAAKARRFAHKIVWVIGGLFLREKWIPGPVRRSVPISFN
jgi:hypothetical protein